MNYQNSRFLGNTLNLHLVSEVRVVLCGLCFFKLHSWLKLLQHYWAQVSREDVKSLLSRMWTWAEQGWIRGLLGTESLRWEVSGMRQHQSTVYCSCYSIFLCSWCLYSNSYSLCFANLASSLLCVTWVPYILELVLYFKTPIILNWFIWLCTSQCIILNPTV